jgi:homocitrate synthase NifV
LSDVTAAVDVLVEDTTLREGEQSPGVAFSTDEKVEIVRLLHELGIRAVEVGTPAMGGPEADAIKRLVAAELPIRLIGWNRGRKSDLDASFECGVDSVHIGLPASDHHLERKFHKSREWVVETMQELVAYAKAQRAWVSVSAEDVGRADAEFLVEYAKATAAAGADRLRMSDTVGVLDPFKAYELFKQITDGVPLPVQAHMHDDFGLATANTLAAVKGGARHVHVTVNGLGERAGIGSLDEVVLGLERHLGIETGIRKEGLRELAEFVARASGRPIPASKPITGDAVFAHESGIHVEGVLKLADTFEPIMPESVGGSREIVIGKHSGSGALQHVLAEHGIEVDRAALGPVLEAVRYQATQRKRALTADELIAVYTEVAGGAAS